jgi:hypothetical protein
MGFWCIINTIVLSGFLVSMFYGLLALNYSDEDVNWKDIGLVLIMSILFNWSSAIAFFVGFNKNKDKVLK